MKNMKKWLVFTLMVLSNLVLGQDDPFRKIDGMTWNLTSQIEYYKQSKNEAEAPTSYYYETENVWRLTNSVPHLSWFYVSGRVKYISHDQTNNLVFVEVWDNTLNRRVPQYCIALHPRATVLFIGDKIECLVYYSYTNLPSVIITNNYSFKIVQYGTPNPSSEQSFLQQIKIQLPSTPIIKSQSELPINNSKTIINEITIENDDRNVSTYKSHYRFIAVHAPPITSKKLTFSEALLDAQKRGGSLATFETKDKWEDYLNQCGENISAHWIGLIERNRQWIWLNGERLNWNNWHNLSQNGRPTNRAVTWENNTWNAAAAETKLDGYILELQK